MKTNKKTLLGTSLLLITAILWGTTFIAQKMGSDYVKPFTYNFYRNVISAVILFIIYFIKRIIIKNKEKKENLDNQESLDKKSCDKTCDKRLKKYIVVVMILVGVSLFLGQSFQQIGITLTHSAAKAGFISSTYLIFVPIIGIFIFKKKVSLSIWICLFIALAGSFITSIKDGFTIEVGDLVTLLCAIAFAFQIIFVDEVSDKVDPILVSAVQFIIASSLSFICKVIFEGFDLEALKKATFAILYAAVFSGCIAFTLQIVGQKYAPATVASVTMSSECVFTLIASMIILGERLSTLEWIGSGLIMLAIILVQLEFGKNKKIVEETQ